MEKNKDAINEEIIENNDTEKTNESELEINENQTPEEINDDETDGGYVQDEISEEDSLREEIATLRDEKIRLLAEMENLRKRFEREKIDSIKYGSVNLARDILSPADNLDRALSAINEEEEHPQSIKNLIEGLIMVKKELSTSLEKNGVDKIDTKNKKFDPNLHQAMMEIENNDLDEGIVVQEIQSGYMMHERLLRPAMVAVSKKPKKKAESESKIKLEDNEKNTDN
jgi:molecular chaperone GrpE